jgi:hypothetical protein
MAKASPVIRFDDLPSEIVLCIFDFLSVADRYKAFFDLNLGLRLLVKRWTEYSRTELSSDIQSFSTLHSWYKHLHFQDGGESFFIRPGIGKQIRYGSDDQEFHWQLMREEQFSYITDERVRAIVSRHSFRLNPFFYHKEMRLSSTGEGSVTQRAFYGGDIIHSIWQRSLEPWLEINYPEFFESNYKCNDPTHAIFVPIFDCEWAKVTATISRAAAAIWNELRELHEVNPLKLIL